MDEAFSVQDNIENESEEEFKKNNKEEYAVIIKFKTIGDFVDFIHVINRGNINELLEHIQKNRIKNHLEKI